ncbi:hypothetical protein AVEN_73277-1, partial [Araneus ventricosus]
KFQSDTLPMLLAGIPDCFCNDTVLDKLLVFGISVRCEATSEGSPCGLNLNRGQMTRINLDGRYLHL